MATSRIHGMTMRDFRATADPSSTANTAIYTDKDEMAQRKAFTDGLERDIVPLKQERIKSRNSSRTTSSQTRAQERITLETLRQDKAQREAINNNMRYKDPNVQEEAFMGNYCGKEAQIQARVSAVSETLASLKSVVEIRSHLTVLAYEKGWQERRNVKPWITAVKTTNRIFYLLEKAADAAGESTTDEKVTSLEAKTKETQMKLTTLNPSEVVSKFNLWDRYTINPTTFKPGWNWNDAQGKGPGIEEEVGPIERAGVLQLRLTPLKKLKRSLW